VADDDRALFEAWCQGDRAAGAALFDRYYEGVARFFHNKVDDAARADLVQSTFLACVEGRARIRDDASFRSYLFGAAHNLLRKHYGRRRAAAGEVDFAEVTVADLSPTASQAARGREEQRLLLEALRRVPLECQEALELHYWEEMSTAEIGAIVGVPEGTVKSRLQRGRRVLEDKLRILAASKQVLESTLTDLDRWARSLREGAAGEPRAPSG